MSPKIAVVLGAGPGLGAAVARALAPTHSLLLLSRSMPGSLPSLKLNVPEDKVLGVSCDSSRGAFQRAVAEMKKKWPDGEVDVGVFNMGGGFMPKSFLDVKPEDFESGLKGAA